MKHPLVLRSFAGETFAIFFVSLPGTSLLLQSFAVELFAIVKCYDSLESPMVLQSFTVDLFTQFDSVRLDQLFFLQLKNLLTAANYVAADTTKRCSRPKMLNTVILPP